MWDQQGPSETHVATLLPARTPALSSSAGDQAGGGVRDRPSSSSSIRRPHCWEPGLQNLVLSSRFTRVGGAVPSSATRTTFIIRWSPLAFSTKTRPQWPWQWPHLTSLPRLLCGTLSCEPPADTRGCCGSHHHVLVRLYHRHGSQIFEPWLRTIAGRFIPGRGGAYLLSQPTDFRFNPSCTKQRPYTWAHLEMARSNTQ